MASVNFPAGLAIKPSTNPNGTTGSRAMTQDIEKFGIAGRIWEGAYLLQPYLRPPSPSIQFNPPCSIFLSQPQNSGRVILELGSGTGYAGLNLADLLGSDDTIILTDLPEVCSLLRVNLHEATTEDGSEHVATRPNIWVRELAWGDRANAEAIAGDLTTRYHSAAIHYIICSDLVYFPTLLPLLLRTLLHLTQPPFTEVERPPVVIFSYKIRSLTFESPFWSAFGSYFNFEPVFAKPYTSDSPYPADWTRLGPVGDSETDSFIFLATRKMETLGCSIPDDNQELMFSKGDTTFESILLMSLGI